MYTVEIPCEEERPCYLLRSPIESTWTGLPSSHKK